VLHLRFFLASFGWNLGLAMTWLAIPLYAHAQGLSNAQIGLLFSIPVLAQAPLNLLGGAYTDRIGGRRIVLYSCLALVLSGVWFIAAKGFWMLLTGQFVLVVARAAFWPANWSMASELPGVRSAQLGRLNAVTNVGQITGTALSGLVLSHAGFTATFAVLTAVGIATFVTALGSQAGAPRADAVERNLLSSYAPLLRQRIIVYTVMCAYVSALPFSLGTSFYPLLLERYGHGETASGILLSLRAIGSIAVGLFAAHLVRTGPQTLWPVMCGIVVAIGVGFSPTINHALPIGFWLFVLGAGSAAMTLYFQITISEASRPEERASALALGGMGWSVSHLSTPLLMGWLADRYGLVTGFYVVGALAGLTALALVWMRGWAFERR
jgi:DHA1 family multidrug resistance protein-like MFS transporter